MLVIYTYMYNKGVLNHSCANTNGSCMCFHPFTESIDSVLGKSTLHEVHRKHVAKNIAGDSVCKLGHDSGIQ